MAGLRIQLTTTLAVSIAALVTLVTGVLLGLQWHTSRDVLGSLGAELADARLELAEREITDYLSPLRRQVEYLTRHIHRDPTLLDDTGRLGDLLTGSVATLPEAGGIALITPDANALQVKWLPGEGLQQVDGSLADNPAVPAALAHAVTQRDGYWAPPFHSPSTGLTYFNYQQPLWVDGTFRGILAAAANLQTLTRQANAVRERFGDTAFVLYGTDHVLAHPDLDTAGPVAATGLPLPEAASFTDPVVRELARATPSAYIPMRPEQGQFLRLVFDDGISLVATRTLHDFGPVPLTLGIHRPRHEVDQPLRRIELAVMIGIATIGLAILAGLWLSRSIARPVRRVTEAVGQVRDFEIEHIADIPGSRIRELDELASSFNGMLAGLRQFGDYVPRPLVRRLIRSYGQQPLRSQERRVTVMFTDIADFTRLAESLPPETVAALLNAHLSMLAACIEAAGGTVDKFMGDGVMAFWGAPEADPRQAEAALGAAQTMCAGLAAWNAGAHGTSAVEVVTSSSDASAATSADVAADSDTAAPVGASVVASRDTHAGVGTGLAAVPCGPGGSAHPPLRLRIGIHTGPALVGNLGGAQRINYTLVGDTVNTAQRLEALGKRIAPDDECVIILSAQTAAELPSQAGLVALGEHQLKGRQSGVSAYRLLP